MANKQPANVHHGAGFLKHHLEALCLGPFAWCVVMDRNNGKAPVAAPNVKPESDINFC